jgi:hypothetical protein
MIANKDDNERAEWQSQVLASMEQLFLLKQISRITIYVCFDVGSFDYDVRLVRGALRGVLALIWPVVVRLREAKYRITMSAERGWVNRRARVAEQLEGFAMEHGVAVEVKSTHSDSEED